MHTDSHRDSSPAPFHTRRGRMEMRQWFMDFLHQAQQQGPTAGQATNTDVMGADEHAAPAEPLLEGHAAAGGADAGIAGNDGTSTGSEDDDR